jgi:HAD superfamily hydrolase (TIGR01509 family)
MMEKSNLREYFDVLISNQDVKNAKPDPEMYLTATAKLGLCPAECLVVEDNPNGIKAAEAAGCPVMVVRGVDEVHLAHIEAALQRAESNVR